MYPPGGPAVPVAHPGLLGILAKDHSTLCFLPRGPWVGQGGGNMVATLLGLSPLVRALAA